MDKIIPVVVIKDIKDTEPTLKALKDGGINCAEICYRTECAPQALKLAIEKFQDMNIGAGTVINICQCKEAIKLGAKFIVSPGLNVQVAKYCQKKKIPYFPGCVTPTEIMQAISLGLTILKFFPAQVYGGLKAMKALSSAFPQIKFIPTGGVDLTNLKEYLEFDKIYAIGGSFLTKGDIVANGIEANKIIKGE